MEAGKLADSASPNPKRAAQKPVTVRMKPWVTAAMLQNTTARPNPSLTPIRSRTPPTSRSPIAYANWKQNTILA